VDPPALSVGDGSSDATSASTAADATPSTSADTGTSTSTSEVEDSGGSSTSEIEGSNGSSTSGPEQFVIGPLTPLDDLDDGAVYPAGSGYDAQWYPSGEGSVDGRAYMGEFPAGRQYYGYMRFLVPALPPGAAVHNVVLELSGHDAYDWDGHALRVWIERSVHPDAIVGTSQYPGPDGVTLSDVSVRWPDDGPLVWKQLDRNESPDLSGLMQSLIDEHGEWTTDGYMQFWIGDDMVDGSGEEVGWIDSIAGTDTAPTLTITYQPS
jgi:hypothetical protein